MEQQQQQQQQQQDVSSSSSSSDDRRSISAMFTAKTTTTRKRGRVGGVVSVVPAPVNVDQTTTATRDMELLTDGELLERAVATWKAHARVLDVAKERGWQCTANASTGEFVARTRTGAVVLPPDLEGQRRAEAEIDALFAADTPSEPLTRAERLRQLTEQRQQRRNEAAAQLALEQQAELERREQARAEKKLAQEARRNRVPNVGFERDFSAIVKKPVGKKRWKSSSSRGWKKKFKGASGRYGSSSSSSSSSYDRHAWKNSEYRDGFDDGPRQRDQ